MTTGGGADNGRQAHWKGLPFLAVAVLWGCSSSRDLSYKDWPEDWDSDSAAVRSESTPGSDMPDRPSSSLPPSPDAMGRDRSGQITIQPDCILQISVAEDPALDGSYPVNEMGAVELGYVGPIFLYNKTERDAEQKIREVLKSRAFRNATVAVKILRASYDKVQVAGAVNHPGLVRIGAGDTISLNDAILRAGGIRATAKGAQVRIVTGGLTNAVALALEGAVHGLVTEDGTPTVPEVQLRNNDIAIVFSAREKGAAAVGERDITVLGEVSRSGVYRFAGTESCTMMHLIFKMGGLPPYANQKAIRILRRDSEGRESEIKVDAEKIMEEGKPEDDVSLENGDRVIVPARRISLF